MNPEQQMVKDFHETFNLHIKEKPGVPDDHVLVLRLKLIKEEFSELGDAFYSREITDIADALADLLYVVYGTAISCDLNMEPIFKEVHRSNMTKVGGYKRRDGKWIKPEPYSLPNLNPLIEEMSK